MRIFATETLGHEAETYRKRGDAHEHLLGTRNAVYP